MADHKADKSGLDKSSTHAQTVGVSDKTADGGPIEKSMTTEKAEKLDEINKPPQPSHPETIKAADLGDKETGPEKAKREHTADPSNEGEGSRQWTGTGPGGKNEVFAMTNVDGEKLLVTRLQWHKYGGTLRQNGWTQPEFAKAANDEGGNEAIPQDVDWGKDKA